MKTGNFPPELTTSPPGTGGRARSKKPETTNAGITTPINKVPDHSKLKTIDEEDEVQN